MDAFIDADSLAYAAGYCEYEAEMRMSVDEKLRTIAEDTGADRLFIFCEHPYAKLNFRTHVAVTKPYKGNRKGREKPPFMVDAKIYMRDHYGAEFVVGMESEDEMTIRAHAVGEQRCVKCAIDKDALMHPGRFYDYRTGKSFVISEDYAEYAKWLQILTGDSVDCIPGLVGVGPKKAEALLTGSSCYKGAVIAAYRDHGHPYEYLLEQARLVYILKRRGEVFTPCTREEYEA